MASTMSEALRECFNRLGGIRTKQEVESWIDKHYPKRWKPGTFRDHLYGGRVNHPLAYKHHPGQKKFLFDHGDHRYELYDEAKHGVFANGIEVSDSENGELGWILIHSEDRYADEDILDNPIDELEDGWPGTRGSYLWHWTRSQPLRESDKPRRILLAWKGEVFGEAIATVTHKTERAYPRANFSFRLSHYELLSKPIPFSALRLGKREHDHRDLIRLDTDIWNAYVIQKKKLIAELPQIETDTCINPQKARQGYGLTAKERQCVELHAMEVAKAYLVKEGYGWKDVSGSQPFDYLATKGIESLSVEVKGTTGLGDKILLTANEVKHQRAEHPRNMLIVVHSIRLVRGDTLKASGGVPQVIFPWAIAEDRLEPTAFAYKVC